SGVVGRVGGRGAALARDDRVDQLLLAQTAEAVDAQLRGDRVQIGERAVRKRGAFEYWHGPPVRDDRWAPAALASAAGDVCGGNPSGRAAGPRRGARPTAARDGPRAPRARR